MGLLSNGYRHMLNGKMFGATVLDGANPSVLLNLFNQAAPKRNQFLGEGIASQLAAIPSGHRHPSAWVMPQKPGAISSRNEAVMAFASTANGVMGYPVAGSAEFAVSALDATIFPIDDSSPIRTGSLTISISVADAEGQLISSGSGSASFSVVPNTPLLTASIGGAGESAFSITTNTPVLGAEASGTGISNFSFAASGAILPLNDASPLRTGTATITLSGSLLPYALGNMIGTTDVVTELTPDAVASAVWSALAAEFNDAGSMGNKLNTASSGGVDLDALAASVWSYATRSMTTAEREALADAVWNKTI